MSETMIAELIQTAVTLIVIPFIIVPALNYVKAKIANDNFKKYFDIMDDAVLTAVKSINQTYVDALKKEGTFGEEEKQEAFMMARTKVLSTMGDAAIEAIQQLKGDKWDEYLRDKIEAAIKK
jgi:type III secretory pathway component EscR